MSRDVEKVGTWEIGADVTRGLTLRTGFGMETTEETWCRGDLDVDERRDEMVERSSFR